MRRAECSSVLTGAPQSQTHRVSPRRDADCTKLHTPNGNCRRCRSLESHTLVHLRTSDNWVAGIECGPVYKNEIWRSVGTNIPGPPPYSPFLERVGTMRYVVFGLCVFAAACGSEIPGTPTAPASAIGGTAVSDAKGGSELPFKGSLEGAATITPLPPSSLSVSIEGTGNATHLGRFTVENTHVVNTTDRTATGTYEFAAANRDTLTAGFNGQASLTATPGVLSIVETATITGGTGRFAGATGSFTVERLFNQVTGLTTGSFEGTISSSGAGKP